MQLAAPESTKYLLLQVSGGFTQILLLESDGSVWTMGCNTRGQLGIGTIGKAAFSQIPVSVDLPSAMKDVGSGTAISFAVAANGRSAYAWGDNTFGQLGIGRKAMHYATTPRKINFDLRPGVTINSMADGLFCSLALLSNGKVLAWGSNQYGQCGQDPAIVGSKIYKPMQIPHVGSIVQVASGDDYSLMLDSKGAVWALGHDTFGQIGPRVAAGVGSYSYLPKKVTGLPPISKIVCGGNNGVALDRQGNVWEWGRNTFGELGNGIVAGRDAPPNPVPHKVAGLPPIISLASQGPTVLAADAQGDVYAWGFNKWGAVGNGSTADVGIPTLIMRLQTSPGTGASVQVAAAHRSSYAYNAVTGQFYAWGENNYGQIGIAQNTVPNPIPVDITQEIPGAILCFVAGTRILSARGEVPVEHLEIGDPIVTVAGEQRAVRWLGHRTINCKLLPRPSEAWPIRVRAGSFGQGIPARDLYLSPGHPVLVGEHLVPIMCLINGTTVARAPLDHVTYWHVELDEHDILLAEGLPAESYIDLGSRSWFDGASSPLVDPDLMVAGHGARCRPIAIDGPIVEFERRRLDSVFESSLVHQCAWPGSLHQAPRFAC